MIEITNVTKEYGLTPVLRGVNLQVEAGKFTTLVGANGAGKTTLLRSVATLAKASGGSVKVGGWQLPDYADKVRQHIGLVSHQSLLYGDLSAEQNLTFFAKLYGLQDGAERVQAVLKQVGLQVRQRDAVRTYSRGMVQRLTIARATLHQPDVLLLDEPYTGLDQEAAFLLDELLLREKTAGRTILLITHNLQRGLHLADEVAILHKGKIAQTVANTEANRTEFLALYDRLVPIQQNTENAA